MERLKLPAMHLAIGTGLVLMSYGLSQFLYTLIHPQMLFKIFGSFQLIYLPHGIQILLTWVYGWLAVPLILPGAFLAVWLIIGPDDFTAVTALLVTLKVAAIPFTFELFRFAGIDARGAGMSLNWRVLFLIGLVAAIFNNLLRYWLACCGPMTADELLLSYTGAVIGDMVGLTVVMFGAMLFFRALRPRIKP